MIKRIYNLIKQYCWGVGGLLTLCYFTESWGFVPMLPSAVMWVLLLIIIVRHNTHSKVHVPALLFLLACTLSIIVGHPDPCFRSWLRLGNFALLFFAVSPLFTSEKTRKIRKQMISTLCVLSVLTAVGSFFCFFLGINYMTMFGAQDLMHSNAGLFGGLCIHSMTLGPHAAIASVVLYYMYMRYKNKWYLLLMAMSLGAVLFSASRSSLLAGVSGIVITTFYFSNYRSRAVKTMVGLVLVGAVTFPVWEGATDLMMQKQYENIEMGSATKSRDAKYEYRIAEFKKSPICGIGFCAIDPLGGDEYHESTGTIEPGTSWGAILSMTGLLGFVFFCMMMWHSYANMRAINIPQRGLLLGLLFLFFVHFIAEGYILSAGGEFCFISWMVIAACCENYKREKTDLIFIADENIFK